MKHKAGVAKYLGSCIFGGFLAYLVMSLRDFDGASVKERFLILADAFTIPGIILLCIGIFNHNIPNLSKYIFKMR